MYIIRNKCEKIQYVHKYYLSKYFICISPTCSNIFFNNNNNNNSYNNSSWLYHFKIVYRIITIVLYPPRKIHPAIVSSSWQSWLEQFLQKTGVLQFLTPQLMFPSSIRSMTAQVGAGRRNLQGRGVCVPGSTELMITDGFPMKLDHSQHSEEWSSSVWSEQQKKHTGTYLEQYKHACITLWTLNKHMYCTYSH